MAEEQAPLTFEAWWESTGIDRHSGVYDVRRQDQKRKEDARAGWDARPPRSRPPIDEAMVEKIAQGLADNAMIYMPHSHHLDKTEHLAQIIRAVISGEER